MSEIQSNRWKKISGWLPPHIQIRTSLYSCCTFGVGRKCSLMCRSPFPLQTSIPSHALCTCQFQPTPLASTVPFVIFTIHRSFVSRLCTGGPLRFGTTIVRNASPHYEDTVTHRELLRSVANWLALVSRLSDCDLALVEYIGRACFPFLFRTLPISPTPTLDHSHPRRRCKLIRSSIACQVSKCTSVLFLAARFANASRQYAALSSLGRLDRPRRLGCGFAYSGQRRQL
jgi:hypothetical protein